MFHGKIEFDDPSEEVWSSNNKKGELRLCIEFGETHNFNQKRE